MTGSIGVIRIVIIKSSTMVFLNSQTYSLHKYAKQYVDKHVIR